jgi:protein SCO1/2
MRGSERRLARCLKMAMGVAAVGFTCAFAQPFGRPLALRNVGIDQKLNYQVPLDLQFIDESGRSVQLSDYFHGKPVVLSLVYYKCPMLCNLVMNGELRVFRQVELTLGKDYEAVTVSFDPSETPTVAAEKKATYVDKYNRPGAADHWHFLTGREDQIRVLADAVGFHYAWDDRTNQWAHASGIVILTPQGRVARYQYGIEYSKNDLRLGLVEASANKIGSLTDQVLLFCYHYDPSKGKYTLAVVNSLRVAGSALVLGIGLFLFINLRRERQEAARHS